jgi:hypothetical protein
MNYQLSWMVMFNSLLTRSLRNAKMQYTSTNLNRPVTESSEVAQHADNNDGELKMNEKEDYVKGTKLPF